MTSCIVGKKIRAMEPGPLELFPFVVLAILMAMAFICVNRRPRWLSWMRRPTGDQEVPGSTPAEVGNILSWR